MALVVCPLCHARITVKDELLGRKAKCPKCANLIELTASEPSPAAIASASPKPAASRPAAPKPVAPKPLPVKPKSPPGPPPLPPPEDTDFAAIQAEGPSSKKRSQPVDEVEEVEEVDELDEVDDRPARRRRHDRRDDRDDDLPNRRAGREERRSSKWDTARLGLLVVYFANFGWMGVAVIGQIVDIIRAISFANNFQPGQPINLNQVIGASRTWASASTLVGSLYLTVGLATLVGHVMCWWTPAPEPRSHARRSLSYLIALVVIIVVAIGITFALGLGGALMLGRGPNRNVDAARAVVIVMSCLGIVAALTSFGLGIASFVHWMVYHGAVAKHFGDRTIQSQCVSYILVAILGPIAIGGLGAAVGFLLASSPGTIILAAVINSTMIVAFSLALSIWYMFINRRVVNLIDGYA